MTGIAELWLGTLLWLFAIPLVASAVVLVLGSVEAAWIARVRGEPISRAVLVVLPGAMTTAFLGMIAPFIAKGLAVDLDWIDTPADWPAMIEIGDAAFPSLGAAAVSVGLCLGTVLTFAMPWFTPRKPKPAPDEDEDIIADS